MKNPNKSFRRRVATGLLSGLSLIVVEGCGAVDFLPISMPAEDPVTGDRPTAVYEGDIQDASIENRAMHDGFIDGVFDFGINPQYDGQPTAPVVTPLRGGEGEPFPFKVTVTYDIDASGMAAGGKLILTDNDMQNFRDDAQYRIDMTAATFIYQGHSSPTEHLVISYNRGRSNINLIDQINAPPIIPPEIACHNNADCGANSLTGNTFCTGDDVSQNYTTYICNAPGTVSSSCSSSTALQLTETCADTCAGGQCVTIRCSTDGECNDSNPKTLDKCINPSTPESYCLNTPTIPTEDLLRQIDSYFANSQGQRLDTVNINPVKLRVAMPVALEQLLASGPAIIRTEENGVGDCIDIGSYTALTRTSPGIYDSTVTFTVGQGCLQDEVAAFVSSLSTTDGFTVNNVYGSAFIHHSTPQAP